MKLKFDPRGTQPLLSNFMLPFSTVPLPFSLFPHLSYNSSLNCVFFRSINCFLYDTLESLTKVWVEENHFIHWVKKQLRVFVWLGFDFFFYFVWFWGFSSFFKLEKACHDLLLVSSFWITFSFLFSTTLYYSYL